MNLHDPLVPANDKPEVGWNCTDCDIFKFLLVAGIIAWLIVIEVQMSKAYDPHNDIAVLNSQLSNLATQLDRLQNTVDELDGIYSGEIKGIYSQLIGASERITQDEITVSKLVKCTGCQNIYPPSSE